MKTKTDINDINDAIIMGINIGVAAGLCMNNNVDNGLKIYEQLMRKFPFTANIIDDYANYEKNKVKNLYDKRQWRKALRRYQDLFDSSRMNEDEFIKMISCLAELRQEDIAIEYLQKYDTLAKDKVRANYVVADLLYFKFHKVEESIKRYEYYIKHRPNDALAWNTLGHLNSELYKDKNLDKQLEYFLNAYKINPNSKIFTKNVAIIYSKLGDFKNAQIFYEHLLKINPSHNDYFDYGCFLIQNGDFKNGYKYLSHRFQKEDEPALYPPMLSEVKQLKTKSQIKDSIILVQCEQGYGDSIMYSRFVKQLSRMAKKVLFVVQNELVDLFKTSDICDEIYPLDVDFSKLEFDYHVPIMDLPYILGVTTKTLDYRDKYLTVNEKMITHFKEEYLNKNKKLKVGVAFEGHRKSEDLNRDIPLIELEKLFNDKKLDVYILQHSDSKKQIEGLPEDSKYIHVGKDFSDFQSTAAAIENMDVIITTDNVILNLAGALGKKTFALFNRFTEYRWFDLNSANVGWYNTVKPFQNIEMDNWSTSVSSMLEEFKIDRR